MGVFDAPAWVLAAWRRSLQDVGATADQATLESYGERMIERWSSPERSHHNLKRLITVLARVDELAPETHDPNVVRLAAWYHGAAFNAAAPYAYAHRGGVDEAASAQLARTELSELGVPAEVAERVGALILRITRHMAPKDDIDAQALCDADLGILAAEPQRYAAYLKQIRAEYAHIPQADYVRARLAIVTKLLARPHIYKSPMAQDWEDAARENLTAELDRLTAEAALPPAEPGVEVEDGEPEAADQPDERGRPGQPGTDGDGVAHPGPVASPAREGAQAAGDGVTPVSPQVDPALPGQVHLPDGGPGPAGFEPVAIESPGAADREPGGDPRGAEGTVAGDQTAAEARELPQQAGSPAAASPARPPAAPWQQRSATPAPDGPETETVAQRSQRRWAEHLAAREAAERGGTAARRPVASTPSPLEPGVGETGANEGVEGATDDFDETSSLSRPPKMPAIKHRPPADT